MKYYLIAQEADKAIKKIEVLQDKTGANQTLESIKKQMIFIRDKADQNKNPLKELELNQQFTYGILSSREFASPEELDIKKQLDIVSEQLGSL